MKGFQYFIAELWLVFVILQISSCLLPKDLKHIDNDVKILKYLDDYFEDELIKEGTRGQFAVLYYGESDVKKSLTVDVMKKCKKQLSGSIFLTSDVKNFDISQCPFIAARIQKKKGKGPQQGEHTENIIIDSMSTCPQGVGNSKNANVYLYTFQRPCGNGVKSCSKAIADFADKCKDSFSILVVGYKSDRSYANDLYIEKSSRAVELNISSRLARRKFRFRNINLKY